MNVISRILPFVLIVYAAYFFGLFVQGMVAPWEYDVSGKAFTEYHKAIDFYMGARMPIAVLSYMGFMLLCLAINWKKWKTFAFGCIVAAFVLEILSIIIGGRTNVSMNPAMNAWNPDNLPANWMESRDKWLGFHNQGRIINISIQILVFLACYFQWTKQTKNRVLVAA